MSRIRCGYANQYQATRAPTCGCHICDLKWAAKLSADRNAVKREPVRTPFDQTFPGMPPAVKLSIP